MNVCFEYLYRDAGNNKIWGETIFPNATHMEIETLDRELRASLIDGEFFVAELVGIPPLCFESPDADLDHGWHEFSAVRTCMEEPTDDRDIGQLIAAMRSAACQDG